MTDSATAPRTRARPTEVHERILDAADRLFYADGASAVGIDRVIAEAGVAKASLYSHFASKDALVLAHLHRRADRAATRLAAALERLPEGAAEARVHVVFDDLWAWLAEDSFRGCPFINAAVEYPDPEHPVRQFVRQHRHDFVAMLGEQLRGGGSRFVDPQLPQALAMVYDASLVTAQTDDAPTAEAGGRYLLARLISA
ncbi:TetR/AcrR family transcriptional regulator [Microbacterium istanbulense]|uniref:TetR family transcriptional regulator n=1 Tax=Microbacterium istanbulense TaxID=3122049 RepID=A0ABU8LLC3_9MICO